MYPYRSSLAQGNVRNGAEGNINCPIAQNMCRMRYDMNLETEAQAYADTCPAGASEVSTRPESGENTEIFSDSTLTNMKVVVQAQELWWKQIFSQSWDFSIPYNQYQESAPLAPLRFIQMAWATSYRVGCGIKRCDYGIIFVCRYRPRGNVYQQYVYTVGARSTLCSACRSTCSEGLCPAP
ncbi:SCP-like protein [Oesophagostomum dentatum]|uniref:SCP-like protein n=1 Tax=Oesophagostomum dentatum TaxID=61180 RepID=A0A0B1SXN6_OESDE|nr:SCP-like protein [Oesophagostomum dentatum]